MGELDIPDHADCLGVLRSEIETRGVDVTISMYPPVVIGPYTADGFTCPHGTTYWIEPTGEQIADWARRGVA